MEYFFLFISHFTSLSAVAQTPEFTFTGQAVEHVSRIVTPSSWSDDPESCTEIPGECSYEPYDTTTCDPIYPDYCWTTVEYREFCQNSGVSCEGPTLRIGRSYIEKGVVTFLNPEFKTGPVQFLLKDGKSHRSSALIPKFVPKGVFIGVRKLGISDKSETHFHVKIHDVKEFQKTRLSGIKRASFNAQSGALIFTVKGKVSLQDEVTVSLNGKVQRGGLFQYGPFHLELRDSLKKLSAGITDNPDGTSTIRIMKKLEAGIRDLRLSFALRAEFPRNDFVMFGDSREAEVPITRKVIIRK